MIAYYLIRETTVGHLVATASLRGIQWASLASSYSQACDQLQAQTLQQEAQPTQKGGLRWERAPLFPPDWSKALTGALEQPQKSWQAPLDLKGSAFQQAIWQVLLRIPPGRLMRYGQIATVAGRPRAARAAGSACGANPVPFLIPCHRVIAHHGQLGGFGLGLALKKILLQREGVDLQRLAEYEIPDPMTQTQPALFEFGERPIGGAC